MNFKDIPYERVQYENVEKRYLELIEEFKAAADGPACMEVIRKRNRLTADMTPMDICYLRHDMDVNDKFFEAEQAYYDEIGPKLADLSGQFDRLTLPSPYREYLENVIGHQAFAMMESAQQAYNSELIELCQEENNLLSRHNHIFSTMTVDWNGSKVKASLMTPEIESKDRSIRKQTNLAISAACETKREELEEKRRKRLGLDKLYSYDSRIYFLEGNPVTLYDTKGCLDATRKMYTDMSPETAEFIAFVLDNELYDVEIRDGKRSGGYMMPLEKYSAPFIMASFDGTTENAYIMCHEGGHAFQNYLKRDEEIREKCWFTPETAETHAMAMEFFAWPYMELFFDYQ